MTQQDLYQELDKKFIFQTYARYPITLTKGSGKYLWDSHGKKYLDFLSGIACTSLGHNHPAISNAIIEQAQILLHTSNFYFSPPSIELAKCLVENGGLDKIFFCNSGTEANEGAIKLARKFHWKSENKNKNVILSATHSFHGRTLGALTATCKPKIQEGFGPLPMGFKYEDWENVDKFCHAIDENVAAVIVEPIQGESGVHVAPQGFLQAVRNACDKMGALLIFDEVQCGIGRSGELFAYQHFKVTPDIITLAKGIAGGMPLGAICAKQHVAEGFSFGDHGTTFGSNPVCSAAALANIKTIMNENYLSRVKQLGNYFFTQLKLLQNKYGAEIKEIRGVGLMLGIELTKNAQSVLNYCQESGLLVNVAADNVIRILPPFIIENEDIDYAVDILSKAIKISA